MRRKAHKRLWTLILTLILCTANVVSLPTSVRAGVTPGETAPPGPPSPGAGDPDVPVGSAPAPKAGTPRGFNQGAAQQDIAAARRGQLSVWMMKVRMAFAASFRVFFRI
jgi:hypothetical protein